MRFAEYSFVTADMQHILLATCDKLLSENNLNVEYQIAKGMQIVLECSCMYKLILFYFIFF